MGYLISPPLGGAIDLLIGTDFVEAFIDIHIVWRTWKTYCNMKLFGWYILRQFESSSLNRSETQLCRISRNFFIKTLATKPELQETSRT